MGAVPDEERSMDALAQEQPEDMPEIEALYDKCFAPGRQALSSYRLRDGVDPVAPLCLVWRDELGLIGGVVRNWPIRIGMEPALLFGPLAVHPTHQGEGLGGLLIRSVIARAAPLGWQRILLVGDAQYYQRFGFEPQPQVQMPGPTNPARILGLALEPGAWDGVYGPAHLWQD